MTVKRKANERWEYVWVDDTELERHGILLDIDSANIVTGPRGSRLRRESAAVKRELPRTIPLPRVPLKRVLVARTALLPRIPSMPLSRAVLPTNVVLRYLPDRMREVKKEENEDATPRLLKLDYAVSIDTLMRFHEAWNALQQQKRALARNGRAAAKMGAKETGKEKTEPIKRLGRPRGVLKE